MNIFFNYLSLKPMSNTPPKVNSRFLSNFKQIFSEIKTVNNPYNTLIIKKLFENNYLFMTINNI